MANRGEMRFEYTEYKMVVERLASLEKSMDALIHEKEYLLSRFFGNYRHNERIRIIYRQLEGSMDHYIHFKNILEYLGYCIDFKKEAMI